jgi:3-(3-hydroxy-phenyl)propionate hydroxylase
MTKLFETPLYSYVRSPDQDAVTPPRHPVVVIGAGPVGLAAAIDLALNDVPVVVLDDNDKVSFGSRATCFARRPLEILDRLGCGDETVTKGVAWDHGRVFFDDHLVYEIDLPTENGRERPPFVNLQQYYLEFYLVNRLREIASEGKPIELRGGNKLSAIGAHADHIKLEIDTPDGPYNLEAEWLIAADGASSPTRRMMGFGFTGQQFEDHFLITDVIMEADLPSERRFWFDPPFNRGQSALLHRQPDNLWRIEFQIGHDIDREAELRPEAINARIRAMLGSKIDYELEWASIYSYQCARIDGFRKGRMLFAGDAAHQVSPFGARGANGGLQDADNLLDSYAFERELAADENITASLRSTEFVTPGSEMSRIFRDAVLDLARSQEFARPLVNPGRLSVPAIYDGSPLNSPDALPGGPETTRPGSPCPDAPLGDDFLLRRIGGRFTILTLDADAPDTLEDGGTTASRIALKAGDDPTGTLAARYLGSAPAAVYLIRPDQHVAARFASFDEAALRAALRRATGKE